MRCFWIWAFFSLFITSPLKAGVQQEFERGNRAFQKGDFEKAIAAYESVLKTEVASAEIYYNLGTAYFKTGKVGKSILNFERARLLDPSDPDLLHNLETVRATTVDQFSQIPEFFVSRWWKILAQTASSDFWTTLAFVFWWCGLGLPVLFYFKKIQWAKRTVFSLAGLSLAVAALLFLLAHTRKSGIENSREAIVLSAEAVLRSAPEAGSAEVEKVHEGTKIILEDQFSGWIKVRLPNGETGWLQPAEFEEI